MAIGRASAGGFASSAFVAGYLYLKRPTQESFQPFFRHWFTDVFVPKILNTNSKKEELEARAKKGSLFQGLKDRTVAWVDGMGSGLMYELVMMNSKTKFLNLGVVVLATVESYGPPPRLPSDSVLKLDFVGVHETWVPLFSVKGDPLFELMEKYK